MEIEGAPGMFLKNREDEDREEKEKSGSDSGEHILVCLSWRPESTRSIRAAARMAKAFNGSFTAVYVEQPAYESFDDKVKQGIRQNMKMASQMGAIVETLYGEDIVYQIAQFAKLSGVTKIIVGRGYGNGRSREKAIGDKLAALVSDADIYMIPEGVTESYRKRKLSVYEKKFLISDLVKSLVVMVAVTAAGMVLEYFDMNESNIIMLYILGTLITAVTTSKRIYSLSVAFVSVLLFNFLFTQPQYTFAVYGKDYPLTFAIMFVVAFFTSSLAIKIKGQARQSAETAYRVKVLLDTNRTLKDETDKDGIISVSCKQMVKLLDRDVIFYPAEGGRLRPPHLFRREGGNTMNDYRSEKEFIRATEVYHEGTEGKTPKNAKCIYFPVKARKEAIGVVGIENKNKKPIDSFENSILASILDEFAIAIEGEKVMEKGEERNDEI